jgi:hypothetical protein
MFVREFCPEEMMRARSGEDTLRELKSRGARRLKSVSFRANRSTIWSLTRDATVLNLHVAYRRAPASILDAFATIVRGRGWKTVAVRDASAVVQNWPGLTPVLEAVRTSHAIRLRQSAHRCGDDEEVTHCCATPEQRSYLRAVYGYLNKTRFDGLLPADVAVRLSNRMTASLGHMIPGRDRKRGRFVMEIALNVDLMLEGNGAERMDTLLHEMAAGRRARARNDLEEMGASRWLPRGDQVRPSGGSASTTHGADHPGSTPASGAPAEGGLAARARWRSAYTSPRAASTTASTVMPNFS